MNRAWPMAARLMKMYFILHAQFSQNVLENGTVMRNLISIVMFSQLTSI